jgi:hypothetical protein
VASGDPASVASAVMAAAGFSRSPDGVCGQ